MKKLSTANGFRNEGCVLSQSPLAGTPTGAMVNFQKVRAIFEQSTPMEEVIFIVEESPEGGYEAKALGTSIYTQAHSMEELRAAVVDAVRCHFEDEKKRLIRLHIVREEVIAA